MTHLEQYETGVDQLENFLYNTADARIDTGTVALAGVRQQLWDPASRQGTSLDFIEQEGKDLGTGIAEIYGPRHSSQRLRDVQTVLAGAYVVASLTPDIALPGTVAVDQDDPSVLKVWMWRQPWRASGITEDQTQVLAAAAQLEAPGMGQHHGQQTAGEAQHLLSMLSIAESPQALQSWANGRHLNHDPSFRTRGTLPAVSKTLLDEQYHVSCLRLRQAVQHATEISIDGSPYQPAPHARLLWHRDSMQANTERGVKVCDSNTAITIVQGAGFMAVQHALGNVERVIRGSNT